MIPRAAAPLVWGLVAAIAGSVLAPLEPNLLEEGMLVHVAQRIARGEVLYRDIVHFTGPLPFELLAALFRVFGEEMALARGVGVVLHALATAAAVALAGAAGAGPVVHAVGAVLTVAPAPLFPLLTVYFYTTTAFQLSWLALLATVRGVVSTRSAVAAGVLVSAVALCKQNLGAVLAALLALVLLAATPSALRVRRVAAMAAGGAGSAAAVILFYGLSGRLPDLVHGLVVLPLQLGSGFRLTVPSLWPPGEFALESVRDVSLFVPGIFFLLGGSQSGVGPYLGLLTQLLYLSPFAAALAALLARLRRPLPPAVHAVLAGLCVWITNLYPRPDWGHLVYALPFAAVLGLLLFARRAAPRMRALAAVLVAGVACAGGAAATVALLRVSETPSFGPRVPQRPVSSVYRTPAVPRVIAFLRERARRGEAIFVARQEPLLYFATDTRNPTPYEGVIPGLREAQETAILRALPDLRFVVMSDLDQPGYNYYAEELPAVQAYLERHFAVAEALPVDWTTWIAVAERIPDRGTRLVDLVREAEDARRFLRDATGREMVDEHPFPKIPTQKLRRPVPVQMGPRGGGIDFEIDVPEDAVLQADVGLRRIPTVLGYMDHIPAAELRVAVGREGRFEVLHTTRVDLGFESGFRWRPIEVDLSAFAGQRVVLRLEALPRSAGSPYAWWGSPRIARRPAAEGATPAWSPPPGGRKIAGSPEAR